MRYVHLRLFVALSLLIAGMVSWSGIAHADSTGNQEAQRTFGAPYPKQWDLTTAADSEKVQLDQFHGRLEILITVISAVVLFLLIAVVVRFNRRANPVPSKRTHNLPLEVLWTGIPLLIVLVILFAPGGSLSLLYYMDKAKNPELSVKITGHQWYWGYELPEQKFAGEQIALDEYPSNIIPAEKIDKAKGQLRLLSVDEPLVLPVDTTVQFLVTGSDVIHAWYMPSFGVNRLAVPGRINEAWAKFNQEGVYFGQCNKICGVNHGYMPIEVHVVSREKFGQWVALAKASGVDKANAAIIGTKTAALSAPTAGTTSLASK